jgi:hypothetical protein
LSDELALDAKFRQVFSGDLSAAHEPMRQVGWATGYALSIYGTEYIQNVHLVRAMGMAMVGRYLYLKAYQWTALGNAIKRGRPNALLPWCRRARSTPFKCA